MVMSSTECTKVIGKINATDVDALTVESVSAAQGEPMKLNNEGRCVLGKAGVAFIHVQSWCCSLHVQTGVRALLGTAYEIHHDRPFISAAFTIREWIKRVDDV